MGSEALRQVIFAQDTVTHKIGERHLGGRDHVVPLPRFVQILLEFGELSGTEQAVAAHHHGRGDFKIAFFQRMHIDHKGRKGALQPGNLAAGDNKARTGNFRRRLEIHQSQSFAKLVVLFRLEIKGRDVSNAAKLDIFVLTRAIRHVIGKDIGKHGECRVQFILQVTLARFQFLRRPFKVCHFADQRIGITAGRLRLADLLRSRIAPGLYFLHFRLDFPLVRVQRHERSRLRRQAASGHGGIKSFRVFPDPF